MHRITGYHRPDTIDKALELLEEPGRIPIGGGTTIRHVVDASPVELVDLQALGLDQISAHGDVVTVGAMVTLADLADAPDVPDIIRETARSELPSTLRTRATVGGILAQPNGDSVLQAALLAVDAAAGLSNDAEISVAALLASGVPSGTLICSVKIPAGGRGVMAATRRTPADEPIVAVVGHRDPARTRLVATGVASTPLVIESGQAPTVTRAPDFRGSIRYREHIAGVLVNRVLEDLS